MTVTGMRLMTGPTGTALALVDHMNIMEVLFAVAEPGIYGRFRETEQILVVAGETKIICAILERRIKVSRIRSLQDFCEFGTMGVMTFSALPFLDRLVQVFLPLQFFSDIAQDGLAETVVPVATETYGLFVERQQTFDFGKMGRMAIAAAPFLLERLVLGFHPLQFLVYGFMAFKTKVGHLFVEYMGEG